MPRTITRTGRQRASLAAGADVVADLLSDPFAVTRLLGDLLDQERSSPVPPVRWVVPRIRLGLAAFDTILVPTFRRHGDRVEITAVPTPDSDVGGEVRMDMAAMATGLDTCRLATDWRMVLRLPLPRTAMRLAGPALDRTVASTVQAIMHRTEAAVLDAEGR